MFTSIRFTRHPAEWTSILSALLLSTGAIDIERSVGWASACAFVPIPGSDDIISRTWLDAMRFEFECSDCRLPRAQSPYERGHFAGVLDGRRHSVVQHQSHWQSV